MTGAGRRGAWLPVFGALAVALLTLQLGNWQLRRADEKAAIEAGLEVAARMPPAAARADEAPAEWTSAALEGVWEEQGTIYVDNRTHRGQAGYHVLTPLRLADGSGWVLVNRGWVAAAADRARLPETSTPGGRQRLAGTVRRPEEAPFALTREASDGRLWQFLDVERYRRWSGLPVAAWTLQQTSESGDGLVRDWPRPGAQVDRHRGYALQWFSLAALAVGLGGWISWTSRSRQRDKQVPR